MTGNLPAQNLKERQVLPTPDSPSTMILKTRGFEREGEGAWHGSLSGSLSVWLSSWFSFRRAEDSLEEHTVEGGAFSIQSESIYQFLYRT